MCVRAILVIRSPLLRDALKRLLADDGYVIIRDSSTAENLNSSYGGVPSEQVDLVIIDAAILAEDREALHPIRRRYPVAKMIVFGTERVEPTISSSLINSIDGLLSYHMSMQTLRQAIGLVVLGEKIMPSGLAKRVLRETVQARTELRDQSGLSERERQILQALLRGSSNKAIARQLGLSEATVKTHLKVLLRRLRASNRTQAAIWAVSHGVGLKMSEDRNIK